VPCCGRAHCSPSLAHIGIPYSAARPWIRRGRPVSLGVDAVREDAVCAWCVRVPTLLPQACVASTPTGGVLALPPGLYAISSQLSLSNAITITTQGAQDAPPCWQVSPLSRLHTILAIPSHP
jgi:hypothetical protein